MQVICLKQSGHMLKILIGLLMSMIHTCSAVQVMLHLQAKNCTTSRKHGKTILLLLLIDFKFYSFKFQVLLTLFTD